MDNHSWKILIIEDDTDDYLLAKEWLSEVKTNRLEIEWAPSAKEALTRLKESSYDAILVDYDLGDRSGVNLIKEASTLGIDAPFIMLTGRGNYAVDLDAMQAGASDYLSKNDANPLFLERTIRYAIERKRAEVALRKANDEMEERVRQRTIQLHHANRELTDAHERLELRYRELQSEIAERLQAQEELARHANLLEKAQEQLRSFAARSSLLAELSQTLAETNYDFQRVLQTIVRRVCELIGDTAVITLLSTDGQHLDVAASAHPDPEIEILLKDCLNKANFDIYDGLAGKVVLSGEPVLVPLLDPEHISQIARTECTSYLETCPQYSALIVPLRVQGKIIGTLGLTRHTPGDPYTVEDQSFLQSLADRAAVAIENSRLFLALQSELSERRRAEARFRAIYQNSAIGIELRDLNGRILTANLALQEMLGYSEEELNKLLDLDLTYPDDIPANKSLFQSLVSGTVSNYHSEKRYIHKNGSLVWARLVASLVRDDSGNPSFVIVMVENITERILMEERLAEIRRRLVHSRESERLSLAQDLHDGPVQDLYGIAYKLADLESEQLPDSVASGLAMVKEKIDQVIKVLRVISGELRPPTLAPFGLEKTIRSHAENFRREHPEIQLLLDLKPDKQTLPEQVRLALFRIYQQALVNVVRHARADEIKVRFTFDDQQAFLEVKDNGQGFEVPEGWIDFVRRGHLGLAGSAERANAVGGVLRVESQSGKGTTLYVGVPLTGTSEPLWQVEPTSLPL
jgi:PAS domain S-box-containing protein